MKSFILSVFALTLFFAHESAIACSCQEWGSPQEMLSKADVAFIGIPANNTVKLPRDGWSDAKTNFTVVRSFKGATLEKMSVLSPWEDEVGSGNCGATWKKDEGLYLVLAYKSNGQWHTSSCSYSSLENSEMVSFVRKLSEISH